MLHCNPYANTLFAAQNLIIIRFLGRTFRLNRRSWCFYCLRRAHQVVPNFTGRRDKNLTSCYWFWCQSSLVSSLYSQSIIWNFIRICQILLSVLKQHPSWVNKLCADFIEIKNRIGFISLNVLNIYGICFWDYTCVACVPHWSILVLCKRRGWNKKHLGMYFLFVWADSTIIQHVALNAWWLAIGLETNMLSKTIC